jgi:hypothetical protein
LGDVGIQFEEGSRSFQAKYYEPGSSMTATTFYRLDDQATSARYVNLERRGLFAK